MKRLLRVLENAMPRFCAWRWYWPVLAGVLAAVGLWVVLTLAGCASVPEDPDGATAERRAQAFEDALDGVEGGQR